MALHQVSVDNPLTNLVSGEVIGRMNHIEFRNKDDVPVAIQDHDTNVVYLAFSRLQNRRPSIYQ